MIKGAKFLKLTALIYFLCLLLIILSYLLTYIDYYNFLSLLLPGIIVGANFFAGILAVHYTIEKSSEIFFVTVLGGMAIRLFLMALMVFICLKFLELKANSFIFSILFFYVFLLIIEVIYLNLRKK